GMLLPLFVQLVIDLAGREYDPLHLRRRLGIEQNALEMAAGELLDGRARGRQAEQALRRQHDERLAPLAQHLSPEQVEVLCRRGRIADLDVVLGTLLEEALEARRGMLRPLSLETVRQEQRESREALPLVFRGGDELVDDHLRTVYEVAELRLPRHQGVGIVEA